LKNPSLILCDEVTSSVDAFAERDIVQTLRSAAQNRTTITVAHRLSSIVHCDTILVIDKYCPISSSSSLPSSSSFPRGASSSMPY
jgi:ABC-type multidrug transport system fused ATPase/permease subunit